jgi:hypothetical protein
LIEFCLAQRDDDGFPTNGINRVNGLDEFGYESWWDTDEFDTEVKPFTQWDPLSYLNIWVMAFDPNGDDASTLGYATFLDEHGLENDGVVIRYEAFGNVGSAGSGDFSGNNLGRTATHEIGHYFNLYHIWGDDFCGDDFVDDTPPQEADNFGCPNFPNNDFNSCGSDEFGEMYMNYMDYVDDECMNMFTFDQSERIDAALFGPRESLLNSIACESFVSVKEGNDKLILRVYPNPADDKFFIQFNKYIESANIKLVDMAGKTLITKSISNVTEWSIDISAFDGGMYFLKTETNNNIITTKVFVK